MVIETMRGRGYVIISSKKAVSRRGSQAVYKVKVPGLKEQPGR